MEHNNDHCRLSISPNILKNFLILILSNPVLFDIAQYSEFLNLLSIKVLPGVMTRIYFLHIFTYKYTATLFPTFTLIKIDHMT